jgi:hypothetical protein
MHLPTVPVVNKIITLIGKVEVAKGTIGKVKVQIHEFLIFALRGHKRSASLSGRFLRVAAGSSHCAPSDRTCDGPELV